MMTSEQSATLLLISSILIWLSNIYLLLKKHFFLKVLNCTPRKKDSLRNFWKSPRLWNHPGSPRLVIWHGSSTLPHWHDKVAKAPHLWYFITCPMEQRQYFFFGLSLNIFPFYSVKVKISYPLAVRKISPEQFCIFSSRSERRRALRRINECATQKRKKTLCYLFLCIYNDTTYVI